MNGNLDNETMGSSTLSSSNSLDDIDALSEQTSSGSSRTDLKQSNGDVLKQNSNLINRSRHSSKTNDILKASSRGDNNNNKENSENNKDLINEEEYDITHDKIN